MKILTSSLRSRPDFMGSGHLDFLFQFISSLHKLYFALSTAERCFFFALLLNVFEKILINTLLHNDEADHSTEFKDNWFGSLDNSSQQQMLSKVADQWEEYIRVTGVQHF